MFKKEFYDIFSGHVKTLSSSYEVKKGTVTAYCLIDMIENECIYSVSEWTTFSSSSYHDIVTELA